MDTERRQTVELYEKLEHSSIPPQWVSVLSMQIERPTHTPHPHPPCQETPGTSLGEYELL